MSSDATKKDEPSLYDSRSSVSVIVSPRQKGNPLIKEITGVSIEYADIIPDYLVGKRACVIFVSLRYHRLHPTYLTNRIETLQKAFSVRVILCQVDLSDYDSCLADVSKAAIDYQMTLLLAWSPGDAARIIELLKSYENKSADDLLGRLEGEHSTRLQTLLTTVQSINKTDALTLCSRFKTFAEICEAEEKDLQHCPGLGSRKKSRLMAALQNPFYEEV